MKSVTLSLLLISLFAFSKKSTAQNVAINATGSNGDASAMLDVRSTTSGFLMPRMTTAEQNAITLPATGLTIYNTTLNTIMLNTGTALSPVWSPLSAGAIDTSSIANFSTKVRSLITASAPITYTNGQVGITQSGSSTDGYLSSTDWNTFNNKWSTSGNAGTTSSNYVGTSDNHSVRFKANSIQGLIIDSLGSVGVGLSPTFMSGDDRELLLVDGGSSTVTNTLINAIGTNNDFLQLNVQNLSNGGWASSDLVATANNGSLSTVYVDMGINSNAYNNGTGNILNGSNTAYLYATGNNFYIGNGAQNKDLVFFTNTSATGPNGTERMRIASNGNIGVGTTSTGTYKLNVSGSVNASGGYTQVSDVRLKKNIAALDYGLNEIISLRPVRYNWKDTAHKENKIGFIAQEVRKVIPEVVTGDESKETIGMSYSELVPVLVNAIKEQQQQIEVLKKEVELLKLKK